MFKRKKIIIYENFMKQIYKTDRLVRYAQFLVGILLVALAFNIFILPNDLVYGVSGVAVMLKGMYGFEPSVVILIGSVLLLLLSFVLLGKEKTTSSIVGSLLYPVFVQLTSKATIYIKLGETEPVVVAVFGAVISGFGMGLIFKSGFTTGGTDILNQIVSKYFKMSIGNAMFFTDGLIIFASLFIFGWQKFIYSVITIYIISIMTDKVILGISQSKAFYIVTNHEKEIKSFIIQHLSHGVTVMDVRGGYTDSSRKMILCVIPTKEYFVVKEGIRQIDQEAMFLVTDAYEVHGSK